MREPRKWSLEELSRDANRATELFRAMRLDEPRDVYMDFFNNFVPVFEDLVDRLPLLAEDPLDLNAMAELVQDDDTKTAFRYLASTPVSEDDLKTIANTTLTPSALRSDPEQAERVRDTILHILDPYRFPWFAEQRVPTKQERRLAVVASAVQVAARKVETNRRKAARDWQEAEVRTALKRGGYSEVSSRPIPLLDVAPLPGEYCRESKLGETRADLIIRLFDRRAMPIECKVSNSAVNSFKRIHHEATGKARAWIAHFGQRQVVPCAVIHGVFNPENLAASQAEGLAIIWSHRLQNLIDFIRNRD